MNPRNPVHPSLSEDEKRALRADIQQAVLGTEGLPEDLEVSPDAYLRLVARTDCAAEEAANLLHEAVSQARRSGHSWVAIGEELGMSRQGAQQRFGRTEQGPRETGTRRVLKGATAFNEMEMLRAEGEAGYHLVDFGPLYLEVEASEERWEHLRITSVFMGPLRRQLEATGWQYVGSWIPFRYFKRPTGALAPRVVKGASLT